MFGIVGNTATTLRELAEERRALDAAEAEWLTMVAAYDRSGAWRADGYESVAAALRDACHFSSGVAQGHVDLARKLESLPVVTDAFGAGDISRAHAAVIADVYTPERAAALNHLEPQLVEIARHTHPRHLRAIVRRYADAIDSDGGAATDAAAHARRRLHLSQTLDGTGVIDGVLEPEGHELVATALAAEMEHDLQANDVRTRPQRRYDALVNLCRRALDRGELRTAHRIRPHVSVVIDIERLAGGNLLGTADAAHIGSLSDVLVDYLTCDCTITRVVTKGPSQIVDVGRATRVISVSQWRALVARDRHCVAPGCDRPPGDCQAHHSRHWTCGGETNLSNLQLLCWQHHRAAHVKASARNHHRPDTPDP
jgi:hypothetical protein